MSKDKTPIEELQEKLQEALRSGNVQITGVMPGQQPPAAGPGPGKEAVNKPEKEAEETLEARELARVVNLRPVSHSKDVLFEFGR